MSTTLPDIVASPESLTECSEPDKRTRVSCPICLKMYADKLNLERHIERIHVRKVRNAEMKKEDLERRRTVMCPVCCSRYTTRNVKQVRKVNNTIVRLVNNITSTTNFTRNNKSKYIGMQLKSIPADFAVDDSQIHYRTAECFEIEFKRNDLQVYGPSNHDSFGIGGKCG
ncbi:unnamed protein product [Caenorhabditis nigoni]